MTWEPVRNAYSTAAEHYIDLYAGWRPDRDDAGLIRRHLGGRDGVVLDVGCGPGHWTGYLHSLGTDVTGIDLVPEFIAHAKANHPGPKFELGSMTDLPTADHSIAGILTWYSTIHMPPPALDDVLAEFRRVLAPAGVLVAGFFDSDDDVAAFDHKVTTAYRWPVDTFSARLAAAGFTELERLHLPSERPDRKYAAIAATAS